MIDRFQLKALKRKVSLQALMSANGLKTVRQGTAYKAFCAAHEEETPSISLFEKKGIPAYYCCVCGKSGDAVTFLQDQKKLSVSEAILELQRFIGEVPAPDPHPPSALSTLSSSVQHFHDRARSPRRRGAESQGQHCRAVPPARPRAQAVRQELALPMPFPCRRYPVAQPQSGNRGMELLWL